MSTWHRRFLQQATLISTWSKDPSTKCGAVIVEWPSNRVVSQGFNGFPQKINDDDEKLNDRDIKMAIVLHAEENAILFSGRNLADNFYTIYVYPSLPCSKCASIIIQSGISHVVTYAAVDVARWNTELSREILNEAGLKVIELEFGDG